MNSKVGRLFNLSWTSIEPIRVYNLARSRLKASINENVTRTDAKELEDFLNAIFIKNLDQLNSDWEKRLSEGLAAATENYINRQSKEIEIKAGEGNFIGSAKHDYSNSKSYILINTLNQRFKVFENIIAKMENPRNGQIKKTLEKAGIEIKGLRKLCEQIRAYIGDEDNEIWRQALKHIPMKQDKKSDIGVEFSTLIEELDIAYGIIMSYEGSLGQIYGQAFEKALRTLNRAIEKVEENNEYNLTNAVIGSMFTAKTKGKEMANRGELISAIAFVDSNLEKQKKLTKIETNEENKYFSLYSTFDDKQGKMDIELKLPEIKGGTHFRISAKSWQNGIGDFGSTTLLKAMLRTVNLDDTLAWGLVVGYYGPINQIYNFIPIHEYAKINILVDILMGYSQKNNYADTIVIQDRSNFLAPISVYSMSTLLDNLYQRINELNISGYDEGSIGNILNLRQGAKEEWYLRKIVSKMQTIKVTVPSSILSYYK